MEIRVFYISQLGISNFFQLVNQALTSFHPRVTCSPPESPDPEKSRAKTVIFEGSNIIAASLASARQPLPKSEIYHDNFEYIVIKAD